MYLLLKFSRFQWFIAKGNDIFRVLRQTFFFVFELDLFLYAVAMSCPFLRMNFISSFIQRVQCKRHFGVWWNVHIFSQQPIEQISKIIQFALKLLISSMPFSRINNKSISNQHRCNAHLHTTVVFCSSFYFAHRLFLPSCSHFSIHLTHSLCFDLLYLSTPPSLSHALTHPHSHSTQKTKNKCTTKIVEYISAMCCIRWFAYVFGAHQDLNWRSFTSIHFWCQGLWGL